MVKRKHTTRRRCRKGGMFGSTTPAPGHYGPQPVHHPQNSGMFPRLSSAMSGVASGVGDRFRRGMNSFPNTFGAARSGMGYGGKRGTRKGKKRGGTKKRKRRGGSTSQLACTGASSRHSKGTRLGIVRG